MTVEGIKKMTQEEFLAKLRRLVGFAIVVAIAKDAREARSSIKTRSSVKTSKYDPKCLPDLTGIC